MSVQSKSQKDTLLAIQKNIFTEYALESLYGTRYQGKAFFTLAVRPFDINADFSLVSKFWILGDDRCRDRLVDKLIIHTTHDEYHEPAIKKHFIYVGDRTPSPALYDEIRADIKDWRDYCLHHYVDMSD